MRVRSPLPAPPPKSVILMHVFEVAGAGAYDPLGTHSAITAHRMVPSYCSAESWSAKYCAAWIIIANSAHDPGEPETKSSSYRVEGAARLPRLRPSSAVPPLSSGGLLNGHLVMTGSGGLIANAACRSSVIARGESSYACLRPHTLRRIGCLVDRRAPRAIEQGDQPDRDEACGNRKNRG